MWSTNLILSDLHPLLLTELKLNKQTPLCCICKNSKIEFSENLHFKAVELKMEKLAFLMPPLLSAPVLIFENTSYSLSSASSFCWGNVGSPPEVQAALVWVVFVWPSQRVDPGGLTGQASRLTAEKTQNLDVKLSRLHLSPRQTLFYLCFIGQEDIKQSFIGCWRPNFVVVFFLLISRSAVLCSGSPTAAASTLNCLLMRVVMMPTASFSHKPDGSQWSAAPPPLFHQKACVHVMMWFANMGYHIFIPAPPILVSCPSSGSCVRDFKEKP